jgi:cation:H+ antiporter
VGVGAFALVIQGPLGRLEALLLVALLAAAIGAILLAARREGGAAAAAALESLEEALDDVPTERISARKESLRAFLGLLFTLAGAQAVVLGGSAIALRAGLSDAFVGLTIVAVGTSLPELAAAVQSVRRGASELLVGNILGSNLFNALAVGSIVVWTGASLGKVVTPDLAGRATILMLVAVGAVGLLLVRRRIDRIAGLVLVAAYAASVVLMAG